MPGWHVPVCSPKSSRRPTDASSESGPVSFAASVRGTCQLRPKLHEVADERTSGMSQLLPQDVLQHQRITVEFFHALKPSQVAVKFLDKHRSAYVVSKGRVELST